MNHTAAAPLPQYDPAAPVPDEYDVFCEGCGYSLIGIAADRCPECGRPYNAGELPYARIPWLHRRRLGRWNAYWRTVRMILFTPRAFAGELCRPVRVSASDARRFRSVTIWLTIVSAALAAGAILWANAGSFFLSPPELVLMIVFGVVCVIPAVLLLRLATDMPTFIWRGLEGKPDALAPLHYYACAPLALSPLVSLLLCASAAVYAFVGNVDPSPLTFVNSLCGGAVLAMTGALWGIPLVFMKTATRCGWRRVAALALYLPVHWFLMTLLIALAFGGAAVVFQGLVEALMSAAS